MTHSSAISEKAGVRVGVDHKSAHHNPQFRSQTATCDLAVTLLWHSLDLSLWLFCDFVVSSDFVVTFADLAVVTFFWICSDLAVTLLRDDRSCGRRAAAAGRCSVRRKRYDDWRPCRPAGPVWWLAARPAVRWRRRKDRASITWRGALTWLIVNAQPLRAPGQQTASRRHDRLMEKQSNEVALPPQAPLPLSITIRRSDAVRSVLYRSISARSRRLSNRSSN